MASERLRELQEMEQRIQQEGENAEIQPAPREVKLGAGSFRVSDQNEAEMEEKKQLLRRRLAGQDQGKSSLGSWRVWAVIGATVLSCIVLLWILFAGGIPDKYENSVKCVSGSKLQRQFEMGNRFDACPEEQWLPDECLDERRSKSKTALERCNEVFSECQYSLKLLQECGLVD